MGACHSTDSAFNYCESFICDENIGCFIGVGIAFGIFSSGFVSISIFVSSKYWRACLNAKEWGFQTIFMVIFSSIFCLPFLAVPTFLSLAFGIWLILLVGYIMPFIYFGCYRLNKSGKCKISNPRYNNNNNNNDKNNKKSIKLSVKMSKKEVNNDSHEIKIWLYNIQLTEYFDIITNNGYETVKDLLSITEQDLNDMGITKQFHVKKIMKTIKKEMQFHDIETEAPPPYAQHDNTDAPPGYVPDYGDFDGQEGEGLTYNDAPRETYQ